MRPKTTSRDLPPRMVRLTRTLKSGKVWVGYYYNGRSEEGKQKLFPLGTDINAAKRKWAELDCSEPPAETGLMRVIFAQYERDVVPKKSRKTQEENLRQLVTLSKVFGDMSVEDIEPHHIARFRTVRSEKAPSAANRELALLSHVFNMAREWGLMKQANPCTGVKKNTESPREYYAEDDVWDAVMGQACQELRDAMDLAYLTGQRPADILKMRWSDVRDGAIEVKQNKTSKRLRIVVEGQLSGLLARIRQRPVAAITLIATPKGEKLTTATLRLRFNAARAKAAETASGELAERIRAFQFRDIRPKAASETSLDHASALLGHAAKAITENVYRRRGETVKPLR